ncbi:toxin glutamine deamidase domain-containing protein [Streptomyces thermolineatus]
MLASTVAVPRNGSSPFHPANSDPWGDLAAFDREPAGRDYTSMARRLNARGCVFAVDAALDGGRATALPWKPVHEAPGWWESMLGRYSRGVEVSPCANWDQVIAAVRETGPDTRGGRLGAPGDQWAEATGHLRHAHNNNGRAVALDGQTGGLARLGLHSVRQLMLVRLRRPGRTTASSPSTCSPPLTAACPSPGEGRGSGKRSGHPPGSPGGCPVSHPVNRTDSLRYVRVSGVRPAWWAGLSESVGTQCLYEWHGVP